MNDIIVEFARGGNTKRLDLVEIYLTAEFVEFIKYACDITDISLVNKLFIRQIVREYLKEYTISESQARDRYLFLKRALMKAGSEVTGVSIKESEKELNLEQDFDPYTYGQRLFIIKPPKVLVDLSLEKTKMLKYETYKELRELGYFDDIEDNLDTNHANIKIAIEEVISNQEPDNYLDRLSIKDIRKRIKYAKSFQERRQYEQILNNKLKNKSRQNKKKINIRGEE